jgi:hypothetical protein
MEYGVLGMDVKLQTTRKKSNYMISKCSLPCIYLWEEGRKREVGLVLDYIY